jgi:hypothetical protein
VTLRSPSGIPKRGRPLSHALRIPFLQFQHGWSSGIDLGWVRGKYSLKFNQLQGYRQCKSFRQALSSVGITMYPTSAAVKCSKRSFHVPAGRVLAQSAADGSPPMWPPHMQQSQQCCLLTVAFLKSAQECWSWWARPSVCSEILCSLHCGPRLQHLCVQRPNNIRRPHESMTNLHRMTVNSLQAAQIVCPASLGSHHLAAPLDVVGTSFCVLRNPLISIMWAGTSILAFQKVKNKIRSLAPVVTRTT